MALIALPVLLGFVEVGSVLGCVVSRRNKRIANPFRAYLTATEAELDARRASL